LAGACLGSDKFLLTLTAVGNGGDKNTLSDTVWSFFLCSCNVGSRSGGDDGLLSGTSPTFIQCIDEDFEGVVDGGWDLTMFSFSPC
jgi:hypothetical protein